jgi:hypothetical protein
MKRKIVFAYSFWLGDDWEMLQRSVAHHENHVDKIVICYQTKSNKGEDADGELDFQMLFSNHILIKYTPDLRINTKANEIRKHDEMLEVIKSLGSTHFVIGAADHFYDFKSFAVAAKDIDRLNVDVSLTKMITYYKQENWMLWPLEDYYMPFMHKCSINLEFTRSVKYPVLVDPSVKVNARKFHIYRPEQIVLHHYSMIRKDVSKKFRNAAASIRWTPDQINTFENEYRFAKVGDRISYFKNLTIIDTKDFDFTTFSVKQT